VAVAVVEGLDVIVVGVVAVVADVVEVVVDDVVESPAAPVALP